VSTYIASLIARIRILFSKTDKAIVVLAMVIVVFSAFGLNQSSVGMYGESTDKQFLEAPPRPIRSDEWYVRLPWVVSRERNEFSSEMQSLGRHDPWITYDLPASGPQVILKPHLSPYLFLDINRAVAAEWWILVFGVAIAAYVFMKALGIRPQIALPMALLLSATPGFHWWNINASFSPILYGGFGGAAFLASLRTVSRANRILCGLLSGWMFACATVVLYPPFQIPTLGALGLVLTVHCLHELRAKRLCGTLTTLGAAFASFVVLVSWFFFSHRSGLTALAQTVYPGARRVLSGGVNITSILGAPYDLKYSEIVSGTANQANQSENSSTFFFALPMIFLLGAGVYIRKGARVRHTIYSLVLWFTCLMSWMLLSLPARFGQLTMLSRVPPTRLKPAIAFTAMILAAMILQFRLHQNTRGRRLLAWGVFAFITLWIGTRVVVNDLPISPSDVWLFGGMWLIPLAIAMTRFMTLGLWLLTIVSLVTVARINPINRSIDPLVKNPLSQVVNQLDPNRTETWMTFSGTPQVRGVIVATGVNSLASVSPYPDREFWLKLDPTEQYKNDWNRYAHIQMVSNTGPTTMKLAYQDVVEVTLDPCASEFPFPSGTYFVETAPSLVPCANVVRELTYQGLRLYVLKKD
jgi:hypothetical protein